MQAIHRPFTRLSNALNLGPTGARLWATFVKTTPGMEGSFEFIHKTNIPRLFILEIRKDNKKLTPQYTNHRWFPSHLEMESCADCLQVEEAKFISWDDCAVDVVRIVNMGPVSCGISVEAVWGTPPGDYSPNPVWQFEMRGKNVCVRSGVSGQTQARLAPGESATVVIAVSLDLSAENADLTLSKWLRASNPLAVQISDYNRFFDLAPKFHSSDQTFELIEQDRLF